jgi:hypothetical protein
MKLPALSDAASAFSSSFTTSLWPALVLATWLAQQRLVALAAPAQPVNVLEFARDDIAAHPWRYGIGATAGGLVGMTIGALSDSVEAHKQRARAHTQEIEQLNAEIKRLEREAQQQRHTAGGTLPSKAYVLSMKVQLGQLKEERRRLRPRLGQRRLLTLERHNGALPDALTGEARLLDCVARELHLDGWVGFTYLIVSIASALL